MYHILHARFSLSQLESNHLFFSVQKTKATSFNRKYFFIKTAPKQKGFDHPHPGFNVYVPRRWNRHAKVKRSILSVRKINGIMTPVLRAPCGPLSLWHKQSGSLCIHWTAQEIHLRCGCPSAVWPISSAVILEPAVMQDIQIFTQKQMTKHCTTRLRTFSFFLSFLALHLCNTCTGHSILRDQTTI